MRLLAIVALIAVAGMMLMRMTSRTAVPARPRPSDDELIRLAHPALVNEGFDLALYRFKILDDSDAYTVTIVGKNDTDDVRQPANQNALPAYEVVIDKQTLMIRRENYVG